MAFGDSLSLKNVAEATRTFDVAYKDKDAGSLYSDGGTTAPAVDQILIRHQNTGSGINRGRRHSITKLMKRVNASGDVTEGAVTFSCNIPNNGYITVSDVKDSIRELLSLLTTTAPLTLSGRIDDLLRDLA